MFLFLSFRFFCYGKIHIKSRLPGEINNLRYADDTTLMAESEEELKSLLMKVKVESEKVGLMPGASMRSPARGKVHEVKWPDRQRRVRP